MKKFVEKKSVKIIDKIIIPYAFVNVLLYLSLLFFVASPPPTAFIPILLLSLIGIAILGMVRFFSSTKDEYTRQFLKYMQSRIDNAKTSDEMQNVLDEFINLYIPC